MNEIIQTALTCMQLTLFGLGIGFVFLGIEQYTKA
jgi:hypothetical protein